LMGAAYSFLMLTILLKLLHLRINNLDMSS
jgi:hypothetical protein